MLFFVVGVVMFVVCCALFIGWPLFVVCFSLICCVIGLACLYVVFFVCCKVLFVVVIVVCYVLFW